MRLNEGLNYHGLTYGGGERFVARPNKAILGRPAALSRLCRLSAGLRRHGQELRFHHAARADAGDLSSRVHQVLLPLRTRGRTWYKTIG